MNVLECNECESQFLTKRLSDGVECPRPNCTGELVQKEVWTDQDLENIQTLYPSYFEHGGGE